MEYEIQAKGFGCVKAASADERFHHPPIRQTATTRRILVVEDDAAIAMATRLSLWRDGHSVDLAPDGPSGLERFCESEFDLVITDYNMPGMTGGEPAAKIKFMRPHQPVLMISASMEDFGAHLPGVDAMLSKPFSFDDLRNAKAELFEVSDLQT